MSNPLDSRWHPRKQEILNRIMKMKSFRPLFIKLCSTTDISWINTLASVIDKIDEKDWILSECDRYEDIKECVGSHIHIFGCSMF